MSAPSISESGIFKSIGAAFRQNWLPCLLLNICAVALVWSYYRLPAVEGLWAAVAEFRVRWSYAFAFFSSALAAAILPFGVQWLMGTLAPQNRLKRLAGLALFWAYRGVEIDLLYRVQAMLFGEGNDARTLVAKVAADQFIYTTLWAVPSYLVALRWIELDYSWKETKATLGRYFWTRTFPTVLITNWLVWIPTASLVYSLPGPLQFPLFSMVMCFFILIVTLLARREQE